MVSLVFIYSLFFSATNRRFRAAREPVERSNFNGCKFKNYKVFLLRNMPLHALFLGRKQRHLKNKSTGGFGGHLKLLFGKTKSLLCVKVFEACILLPLPSCLWIRVSQQDTIVYVVISLVRVTLVSSETHRKPLLACFTLL